jgi:chromosome partitioning protein
MTRKRAVNEHERTAKALRDECRTGSFELFETEIPEAISIAQSLKKNGAYPTFTNKWGTNMVPLLNKLAQETMEALHGA